MWLPLVSHCLEHRLHPAIMQSAWTPDAGNNDAARVMHAAGRDYLMSCDRIYAKSVKGPKVMWMRDRDMITNERFEGC